MTHMFPLSVQNKIADMHIAYKNGKKADSLATQISSSTYKLKQQADANIIVSCEELEAERVSGINDLINKLETKGKTAVLDAAEKFKSLVGGSVEWCYEAKGLQVAYKALIEEANSNGAEIYDSILEYKFEYAESETIELAVSIAQEQASKHNFKFKIEHDKDSDEKLTFLTTTTGMELIFDAIHKEALTRKVFSCSRYETSCKVLAMPLTTPPIKDILEKYGFAGVESKALVVFDNWMFRSEVECEAGTGACRIFAKDTSEHVNGENIQYIFSDTRSPRGDDKVLPLDDAESFIKRHQEK